MARRIRPRGITIAAMIANSVIATVSWLQNAALRAGSRVIQRQRGQDQAEHRAAQDQQRGDDGPQPVLEQGAS